MSNVSESISKFLNTKISLAKLELVVIELPQLKPFRSAIGIRNSRKALIVIWHTHQGVRGYGECSCRPDPFYSHEFIDGSIQVIQQFIVPLIKAATSYRQVLRALNKVRGWNFTKAAIEFAMNDAIRKITGIGILEAWKQPTLPKVPVGISMGLFENGVLMSKAIKEAEHEGYQRLKFKINPASAKPSIIKILEASNYPNLSFDANGSFSKNSFDDLEQFAKLGCMIEQPFAPGNSYLKALFEKHNSKLIYCLDEEIETLGQLIEHKLEIDELNIKPGRVGGLYNTIEMIEYCFEHNIAVWIGGMFETGIGRAQNLQIASFLLQAKAHDQSPSNRYFIKDVLMQPIEMNNGFIDAKYFINPKIDEVAFKELTVRKLELKNI